MLKEKANMFSVALRKEPIVTPKEENSLMKVSAHISTDKTNLSPFENITNPRRPHKLSTDFTAAFRWQKRRSAANFGQLQQKSSCLNSNQSVNCPLPGL